MGKDQSGTQLRAILHFLNSSYDLDVIKLRMAGTIFGRESGDIILRDNEVSSTHCQIQYIKKDYYIFDMNSSNGTIVNGAKVIKQKLEDGDRILIGKTEMLFKLEDEKQVRHISTISSAMKEFNTGHDKTSIVDTLIENEIKNNQRWEVLLSVTYADGSQEDYRIQQNTIFIGRATSFGKFEDDSDISRRHLMIKLNDNGEVFIEDEGSTNGSYLNGKRIRGIHLVGPNDEIKLGSCRLRIQSFSR